MSEDPAGAGAGPDAQPAGDAPPGREAPPGGKAPPGWGTQPGWETPWPESPATDKIGINATDLNCLNILSFSGHMTAGELARATGLTTASITGVVDRLEEARFVTRERDPHDRRRVVVQINLDRAMTDVAAIFAPMLRSWREMAARYSDDELRLIVDFYGRMEQVFRDHLVRLRGGPEATEP
jgi:DNA-binding MarR family transcriptional regulator